MGWYVITSAGPDGNSVIVSGHQGAGWVPLVFTSIERVAEYIERHKPAWATVAPATFEPMSDRRFFDWLATAASLPTDRRTHFTIDPPADGGRFRPYSIANYLSDPAAVENAADELAV
jgi:hypothetical protein